MNLVRMAHTNVLVVGPPTAPREGSAELLPEAMTSEEGPGPPPAPLEGNRGPAGAAPLAEVVVLRKTKRLAPEFHRHIVQGKLQGQEISQGEKVLVYEVQETVPEGRVRVGPSTRLEFK
jgi:hypothetical protein